MAKDQNSGNQESLEDDMDAALNDAAEALIVESGDSLDEPIQSETEDHQEESITESDIEETQFEEEVTDSQTDEQQQETQEQEQAQTVDDQVTDQSETTEQEQTEETQGEPESQADKDYKNLQAAYTKSQQANKDQEARLAAMEKSIADQQAAAQQAALKPYQPESPDYQAFQPKKAQMDIVAQSIRDLTTKFPGEENEHVRDSMTETLSKQFSDADWATWQESVQFENQRKQSFYEDPEKAFGDLIDKRLNGHNQQQQATQSAEAHVNDIFNHPAVRAAINIDGGGNERSKQMQANIEGGMSVAAAAKIAVQEHEIATLRSEQKDLGKKKQVVDERRRLMRSDATPQTVNPVTASTDVEEQLKAKGIVPGSDNYENRLLDNLMEEDEAWEESPTGS